MRTSCHRIRAALVAALFLFPLSLSPQAAAEELVAYSGKHRPGTVLVNTSERRLYLVLRGGKALRYTVGVGRAGKQWAGRSRIIRKMMKPAWVPPPDVKRDIPGLPDYVAGGSSRNPLGAAALILAGGEYAIHGTNRPGSIGGFVSYGCIRMYNRDIVRLFSRVRVGTPVVVR